MTRLRSGSATDVGKVRSSNQDVALEDPDLFAVADGMGGHVGGEVAARVAIDTLRAAFQRQPTVEGLRRAVAEANRAVWRQGQSESGLRGMGTTLTATALVNEDDDRQVIALANVGDSRAYVFSKGQVIQVTADHSLAEEKVRQGQLTEAEAAVHPHRHILTRALGVSSDVDVDLWELHLHDGDRVLLCSDGLTNEIGIGRIGQTLEKVADPKEAARALVKAAVDHGGSDNVTVVVVDVVSADSPPGGNGQRDERREADSAQQAAAIAEGEPDDGTDPPAGTIRSRRRRGGGEAATEAVAGAAGAASVTRTLRPVGGTAQRAAPGSSTMLDGRPSNGVANGSASAVPSPGDRTEDEEEDEAEGEEEAADETGLVPLASLARSGPGAPIGLVSSRQHVGSGPVSGARVQAAELRRWHPAHGDRSHRGRSAPAPRLITVRVVLFVVLLLAVVAAAYALVRWYAMDDWYVGVDHNHLAVYQGRPGGFLWFKPQLVDETPVTTTQILSFRRAALRHDPQWPSFAAAKGYVSNLRREDAASKNLATGSTATTPGTPSAPASSGTTPPSGTGSTSTT